MEVKGRAMSIVLIPPAITGLVEVARSFSYKLNCSLYSWGQPYESRDFFCSQKAQCRAEDAAAIAEQLHQFCRAQVLADVRTYIADADTRLVKQRKGA
jgi:hypothetical protein